MRETGSHLVADMVGFEYAASQGDVAAILHAEAYLNVHRDRKKQKKPIELWRPFGRPDSNADVTPERRAELVEQLRRRSVFGDR